MSFSLYNRLFQYVKKKRPYETVQNVCIFSLILIDEYCTEYVGDISMCSPAQK